MAMAPATPSIGLLILSIFLVVVLRLILPPRVAPMTLRPRQGKPSSARLPVGLGLALAMLILSAFIGVRVGRLIIITGPSALIALGFGVGLWPRTRRKHPAQG